MSFQSNDPMDTTPVCTGYVCTQCLQSKNLPISISKTSTTPRPQTAVLIEPKTFCKVPMC